MTDWEIYKSNVDDMEIDTEEEDMGLYMNNDQDGEDTSSYNGNYYQRQAHSYTAKNEYMRNIGSPHSETTSDNDEHIRHEFLDNGVFNEEKYQSFKENAIEERASLGAGKSHMMNMLFCFWCFYLRETFNNDMYIDFLTYAREDRSLGANYGIQCFYRFCSYGLEQFWNQEVYEVFEDEAMSDYWKGNKYGLEKFKAFHINQKYDFPIPIKPETQKELDKYPTCRSFRESPPMNGLKSPRRISDSSRVTFKFGSMPQPKSKQTPPPPPANNNQQQKKSKNHKKNKNKNKNKFNYVPPQNNTEMTEKEKEANEKKKELEKANSQTEVHSLPGKALYRPPTFSEDKKELFQAPPQMYKPKYHGNNNQKNMGQKEWTFGKAQPQSLPKNSSFRRNKW